MLTLVPDAQALAQENRGFLRRVVAFLAEQGIRQFIDLGSGIPTVGNTHDVAQRIDPGARVVHVDNEPVAVAHSELLLQDNEPEVADVLAEYSRSASRVTERDLAEVTRLFDGYDLVSPGVVFTRAWRPEIELEYRRSSPIYGGVGLRI